MFKNLLAFIIVSALITVYMAYGQTSSSNRVKEIIEGSSLDSIVTDQISEKTAAEGVTIDGVLLKDSTVLTDNITEQSAAAGVTIEAVLIKDSEATAGRYNVNADGEGLQSVNTAHDISIRPGSSSGETSLYGASVKMLTVTSNDVTVATGKNIYFDQATSNSGTAIGFIDGISANTINEYSSGLGVTIDSVLLKDDEVSATTGKFDSVEIQGTELVYTCAWRSADADYNAANCSGTCPAGNQRGACFNTANITRSNVGNYTMNFAGSFWSSAPACTGNSRQTGRIISITSESTSSINVRHYDTTGSGADGRWAVTCTGVLL